MRLRHPLRLLYPATFIIAVQYGLVVYINSSFLGSIIDEKVVGIIFTIASLLSIWILFEMPKVLKRLGNYTTSLICILINALLLLLLGISHSATVIVLSFILYNVSNYCLLVVRDVFIEDYTRSGSVGKTRGLILTAVNVAMVFAPSVAAYLVTGASYKGVYVVASLATFLSLFCIFPWFKNFKDPEYRHVSFTSTIKKILVDSNLKKIYFSQFLLWFFYAWMVIYMPIHLQETFGFSWREIGLIFSIMLIPFVLVDYPLGRLSDTLGEKKILAGGFCIMSLATISIFFLHTGSVALWASVLFITRIGAATVEVMNESYFFKKISPSDASLISFFRNISPLAFIIAPLCATILLFFNVSLNSLFLVLGIFVFAGFVTSLKLRDLK